MGCRRLLLFTVLSLCCPLSWAASKPKTITYGKTLTVKLFLGPTEGNTLDMKVKALYVDGNLKEFTTGDSHDITDRVFVIRKAYRLNDSLPEDSKTPKWKWQRGDWLLVDRLTAKITPVRLPLFDPFYSNVSWYRDYAAYCGISDDAEKLYAVVAQIGRKKPVLHKTLGDASQGETPDADCEAPQWERTPSKVTFLPKKYPKVSYTVFGHATDVATDDDDDE